MAPSPETSKKKMSKQIDFAGKRRAEGRSLSKAVDEIIALLEPIASQSGIDFRARSAERQRLLAERLQESVVPLFIYRGGQPDRIGSFVSLCVWIQISSRSRQPM
jgi:hypothetical protein